MDTDFYIPSNVSRPARYLGIERNAVFKDLERVRVRFALCYPDIYEVGMSYYGYFLLYEIANAQEDVWCERCFAPWVDMESFLRESKRPLFTIESKTPLFKMDIVGFSLTYELNMTNVLNMMELGWIKQKAEERRDDPVVIAGGPSMMNPAPYEPFFDLIVIGEAEHVLVELLNRFKELKGMERWKIIRELADLDGVYSPIFPKDRVTRLYVKDLDASFHAKKPPVAIVGSIHDRLNVEISRGCGSGCRFCLAGYIYRPYRERSLENVKEILDCAIMSTGYEEVSFLSLSAGDHTQLTNILWYVSERFPGTSISLPSLRIGSLSEEEISLIGRTSRTGLTFALEAASESLRKRINKKIDLDSFYRQIPSLIKHGWRYVKIYLMVGFPWETEEDFQDLMTSIYPLIKWGMEVQLSISPFVPKPHTPFQYLGMDKEVNLREKIKIIKDLFKGRKVKVRFRDVKQSFAEAIISRGDKRLSELFSYLRRHKVRMEAWREFFNFQRYVDWFNSAGLEMEVYLGERRPNENLPWDFIDSGISKDFLFEEYRKSESALQTPDCFVECSSCGVCQSNRLLHKAKSSMEKLSLHEKEMRPVKKISLRYGKLGKAKYIGHIDTMKSIIRALRSSGILFKMHGKYHPMPKVSLSPAIPVGLESTCEWIVAEVVDINYDFASIKKLLNLYLPKGIRVFEILEGKLEGHPSVYLIVSQNGQKKEGFELLRERNGKRFYVFRGTNIKEILKDGKFERIVKIREGKEHVLRVTD